MPISQTYIHHPRNVAASVLFRKPDISWRSPQGNNKIFYRWHEISPSHSYVKLNPRTSSEEGEGVATNKVSLLCDSYSGGEAVGSPCSKPGKSCNVPGAGACLFVNCVHFALPPARTSVRKLLANRTFIYKITGPTINKGVCCLPGRTSTKERVQKDANTGAVFGETLWNYYSGFDLIARSYTAPNVLLIVSRCRAIIPNGFPDHRLPTFAVSKI